MRCPCPRVVSSTGSTCGSVWTVRLLLEDGRCVQGSGWTLDEATADAMGERHGAFGVDAQPSVSGDDGLRFEML